MEILIITLELEIQPNSWRNFFKGDISEVGIWDECLDENEIKSIFDNGVVNKKGNFSITTPCGFWNFKSGYGNMTFDISGNNNHGYFSSIEFGKKFVKSSTERYLPYRSNGYYRTVSHRRWKTKRVI